MTIEERILERYPDEEILMADGYDDAIIGIDESTMRLIYSKLKCIDILMENGMEYQDALDYFYFNTINSNVGDKTPIWCFDDF